MLHWLSTMLRCMVVAAMCLGSSATPAALITFGFTATVDFIDTPLQSVATPGERWSGRYAFDSNAIDFFPSDPTLARYESYGGFFLLPTSIGTYRGDGTVIQVRDRDTVATGPAALRDSYSVFTPCFDERPSGCLGGVIDGPKPRIGPDIYRLVDMSLVLSTLRGVNALDGDRLPRAPPSLASFGSIRDVILEFENERTGGQFLIFATVDTLFLIPEPAGGALVAIGLLAIFCTARRRTATPARADLRDCPRRVRAGCPSCAPS